eukprot:TRINITY_DN8106_c0_g1_i3.p1 TRINITY_DN8106_c0_g1~~TRINITY_DN8106_c0_g1_i3.p1  ORF type:complete len:418 (+),score=114.77 TRINITY_DN8106_c0_g1_i3:46-1254(+)
MLRSLVGSEMCIRDSSNPHPANPSAKARAGVGSGLLHRSEVAGKDAIVGFAAYDRNILHNFKTFVWPLRTAGYDGHIIIGTRRNLDPDEVEFLKEMKVTMYAIDLVPCDLPWMKGKDTSNKKFGHESERIRGVCVQQYPRLKMEWARFQLGADWIMDCHGCAGWNLLTDFRDTTYQTGNPFGMLGDASNPPSKNLWLVEEWYGEPHPMTNDHWFSWSSMHNCYGREQGDKIVAPYRKLPVLCSGTVIGNGVGIQRYATVMTNHFYDLIELGEKCVTPSVVDQAVQIQLYYHGKFGPETGTLKYGEGPVLTIGGACAQGNEHSLNDVIVKDDQGFVLNNDGKRAPIVHQFDRCHENYAPLVMNVDTMVKLVNQPSTGPNTQKTHHRTGTDPPAPAAAGQLWSP